MDLQDTPEEIRILDADTVSQISAGEVVERPASVVKELVETALDAGAGRIEVGINSRKGMITGIRVSDNGCGMSPADAELACVRHATSKIRTFGDLAFVHSLGFRGEALASIAAVSRLTLTTRKRGSSLHGVWIVNDGGKVTGKGIAGCPEGTTVEVEEIFSHIPARRKFMRSLAAEMAYITGIMERTILSHPNVAFHVLHNRRVLMSGPGGSLHETALHLFGTDVASALIPVSYSGAYIRVEGEISHPSLSRQNHYQVFLTVNCRPVQSKALALAVRDGYGTLLPSGRFPVAILDISMDPGLVDVNVHPTKREVRLGREAMVRTEISHAVKQALEGRDLTFDARKTDIRSTQSTIPDEQISTGYRADDQIPSGIAEPARAIRTDTDRRLNQTELSLTGEGEIESPVPEIEFLGQLDDTYILACPKGGEDLILIDQHAAHERILYDQLEAARGRDPECQELIVPVALHLSPREAALLPSLMPVLEEPGFSLEEFGKGTVSVRAIPVVLGKHLNREGIREILAFILAGEAHTGPSDRDQVLKTIACRGAIKGGTPCTPDQCRMLISQLRRTPHPFSCPHGRPTMVTFKKKDLDSLFYRK